MIADRACFVAPPVRAASAIPCGQPDDCGFWQAKKNGRPKPPVYQALLND